MIDGVLNGFVEPSNVKAVYGAVVDLQTNGKHQTAVFRLIFSPAHAGNAVVGVHVPLVGQRQHRKPRKA